MSNLIRFKKSETSNKKPNLDNLVPGELALNIKDGIIFMKTVDNKLIKFKEFDTYRIITTPNIDISTANIFSIVLTSNISFNFVNIPNNIYTFKLLITNNNFNIIFPNNMVIPNLTPNGTDLLEFTTVNNGTKWIGYLLCKDIQ